MGLALALSFLLAGSSPGRAEGPPSTRPTDRTQTLIDSASQAWFANAWTAYARRFVGSDGRVQDNGNGGISHSEGQGYGLLLAAKAGDAARFATIWQWTRSHLMVRRDSLAAWKWEPAAAKVTDTNNATDGDILIAWALAEGARRFERPDYREAGRAIAQAIGTTLVVKAEAGLILLPAAQGFAAGERPDGPVVNLSYWVFPAFAALQELAPSVDWARVRRTGLARIQGSRFGTLGLPAEWESLAGPRPTPAAGLAAGFGYNAIRIPLYLALDGAPDARRLLARFADPRLHPTQASLTPDAQLRAGVTVPVEQPGYDLVLALARCVSSGVAIPPDMISTPSDLYFPETLRLLSVTALQERFPACL